MGNQKQKWASEEEEALRAGVAKHGTGKWKNILKDPHFAPSLTHRSNIDLKDKWRNIIIVAQGSEEKSRIPTIKTITTGSPAIGQNSGSADDNYMSDDPLKSTHDGKTAPRACTDNMRIDKDSRRDDLLWSKMEKIEGQQRVVRI
ncbi:hypothetical protein U1Q18_026863 [Sarracenia purpurea var. burkii]